MKMGQYKEHLYTLHLNLPIFNIVPLPHRTPLSPSLPLCLFPFAQPSESRFQISGHFIPEYSACISQEQAHGSENIFEAAIHLVTQCSLYRDSEKKLFS